MLNGHIQTSPRPKAAKIIVRHIPQELKELRHWVVWKYQWKPDEQKWSKPPLGVNGHGAKSNDETTWAGFDLVLKRFQEDSDIDGPGFMLSPPYVGIDLDHCRDPQTGDVSAEARLIVERLNSYTEVSPSGTGLHIFAKGTIPRGRRNDKLGLEIYTTGRFLTVTGRRLKISPTTIEYRHDEINWFLNEFIPKERESFENGNGHDRQ